MLAVNRLWDSCARALECSRHIVQLFTAVSFTRDSTRRTSHADCPSRAEAMAALVVVPRGLGPTYRVSTGADVPCAVDASKERRAEVQT